MHSAHPNIKRKIMEKMIGIFPLCGGCSRREKREGLREGEFYCAIAEAILPDGTVTNDTDTTSCNQWQLLE